MRIDLNAGILVPETSPESKAETSSRSTAQPGGRDTGESRFSASQNSVSELATSALGAPEVRSARVEALKAQIESGTYRVSGQQIANSLLEQLRAAG